MPAPRPLERLPTLKLRLAFVILLAVAATDTLFYIFVKALSWWPIVAGALSGVIALLIVWFFSRGTLEPLRNMASASEAIARGEFATRVPVETPSDVRSEPIRLTRCANSG